LTAIGGNDGDDDGVELCVGVGLGVGVGEGDGVGVTQKAQNNESPAPVIVQPPSHTHVVWPGTNVDDRGGHTTHIDVAALQ
jgi:hypothetical protein